MQPFPHPKILQVGTYSSWNKGDAAMQLAMAAAINERWPDAHITISAPFPHNDSAFYKGVAEVVPCHRRRLIFASFQVVRAGLWRLIRKLTGLEANWLIPETELRATLAANIVIDLSGDMLTDDYGPHVAYSHYIPIINALLLDRPVFICAQSIGPFRWTGWLARQIFHRVDAITVRDEISLEHLEAIGLDLARTELTADMAFLLNPVSPDRVDQILALENIRIGNRAVLGVSLSRILEHRYMAANRESGKSFVQLLADVLDAFAIEHECDVLFVPHVTGPSAIKDDRRIGMEVAATMKTASHVISGNYRPEELKGVISRCSLFLGARMHANIGALSSGIPVVALSYSHKTLGIMDLFGQRDFVMPGETLGATPLHALLARLWTDRAATGQRLAATIPDIRDNASRNMDIIDRIIHQ